MSGIDLASPELRALVSATEACMEQCRVMLELETRKRQILLRGEYDRLNEVISSQQSAIMQLFNCENDRVDAQKAAGLEGLTARDIAAKVEDPEQRRALDGMFNEWRVLLDQVKTQNEASLDLVREDLRLLDAMSGNQPTQDAGTYGRSGRLDSAYHNSFKEKV